MKNMNIEIDKRKLLDSVLKSLKENELGYGSTSAQFYYDISKAYSFSGMEDNEVESLISSAETELRNVTYSLARAASIIGYLKQKEEISEEMEELEDSLHQLIENEHMMVQSLIDSFNIEVKLSFEKDKKFGGYNPLEDPHGGK